MDEHESACAGLFCAIFREMNIKLIFPSPQKRTWNLSNFSFIFIAIFWCCLLAYVNKILTCILRINAFSGKWTLKIMRLKSSLKIHSCINEFSICFFFIGWILRVFAVRKMYNGKLYELFCNIINIFIICKKLIKN